MSCGFRKRMCAALTALLCFAAPAFGQEYPARPVKLLVGFQAGGTPDSVARLVGEQLAQSLKQPFVVENRVGASGTLAAAAGAKAPADGYTLSIIEAGQLAITPLMVKVPYDPIKDFLPIALLARNPMFLVVSAGTGFKEVRDLVRAAKAAPGKINYGSIGVGSIVHLGAEVFRHHAGIELTHIPYQGAPQVIPALAEGQVQAMVASAPVWAAQARAGKITPLAVMMRSRHPKYPDVPAIVEIYPEHEEIVSEIGLMAPAGTPAEILQKLAKASRSALDDPEVRAKLDKIGFIPSWSTPQEYAGSLRQGLKTYERAIKIANVKPE